MPLQPTISVIIPVYNRQAVFLQALKTVCAQSYPKLEIIVVDDGSEPRITIPTELIPEVKLIRQNNQGAPAARNAGFAASTGELVIFWDADNLAEPDYLTKLHEALIAHPEASYAYCDFKFGHKLMRAQKFKAEKLREINYITMSSLIWRQDFPGFDTTLKRFQDWDLWLTMLTQNKIGIYVPECLFEAKTGGTMSTWLPRVAYYPPLAWFPGIRSKVQSYRVAKQVVIKKHGLPQSR